jgi:hypothetical protein
MVFIRPPALMGLPSPGGSVEIESAASGHRVPLSLTAHVLMFPSHDEVDLFAQVRLCYFCLACSSMTHNGVFVVTGSDRIYRVTRSDKPVIAFIPPKRQQSLDLVGWPVRH